MRRFISHFKWWATKTREETCRTQKPAQQHSTAQSKVHERRGQWKQFNCHYRATLLEYSAATPVKLNLHRWWPRTDHAHHYRGLDTNSQTNKVRDDGQVLETGRQHKYMRGCGIYPARPRQCRDVDELETGEVRACEGVLDNGMDTENWTWYDLGLLRTILSKIRWSNTGEFCKDITLPTGGPSTWVCMILANIVEVVRDDDVYPICGTEHLLEKECCGSGIIIEMKKEYRTQLFRLLETSIVIRVEKPKDL